MATSTRFVSAIIDRSVTGPWGPPDVLQVLTEVSVPHDARGLELALAIVPLLSSATVPHGCNWAILDNGVPISDGLLELAIKLAGVR